MMVLEEFTSIAIWVLMAFLVVNSCIIWFATSETFTENSSLQIAGLSADSSFGQTDINNSITGLFGEDCSSAGASDASYSSCLLSSINPLNSQSMPGKILSGLWTLLTAWVNILTAILSGIPGGSLFLAILIPFFGLIEFSAIFVILMQIAGIIRGGS